VSTSDPLERFIQAQETGRAYERALAELKARQKTGHWMWFVFPQIAALGRTETSERYAIANLEEAKSYLDHPVLGPRLIDATRTLCATGAKAADEVLGPLDAMKLRSSMTLFMRARPEQQLFSEVLSRYFDGKPDEMTDHLLSGSRSRTA
jgi:uncharacterized protein (DUF1810 family)